VLLERAGYRIALVTGREGSRSRAARHLPSTPFVSWAEVARPTRAASIVVLGVPDDLILTTCTDLEQEGAFGLGQTVLHLSGSVSLDALNAAEDAAADVLSLHPLQSFPDVERGIERLPGSPVAVTAREERTSLLGESLARDAGGLPFRLDDQIKPLYHAAAVFCSNYLVAVEGMAEHLFRLAGLEAPVPMFAPLARAALDASLSRGPRAALTGPAARGDVGTIARNLGALAGYAPEAIESYLALAGVAARLAAEDGRLSEEDLRGLEEVLARWR
jgi:predicted short-subunit dehydrogenase-like oxidoreductase (DUF2520 family)